MIEIEPRGKLTIIGIVVIIFVIFMLTRTPPEALPDEYYEDNIGPGTVTGFYQAPAQDIEQLITGNPSAIVIDCSSSSNDFMAGDKLPRAVWSPDVSIYYGQNMELILYSNPPDYAIDQARSLVGKMYGSVYVLTGGYSAWENWINRVQ